MTRLQKKSSAISSIAAAGASREARRRVLHRSERRPMSGRDEQVTKRDAPDESLWVNCGRCGTPLLVRLEEVKTCRTIECADCTSRCRHAFANPSLTLN